MTMHQHSSKIVPFLWRINVRLKGMLCKADNPYSEPSLVHWFDRVDRQRDRKRYIWAHHHDHASAQLKNCPFSLKNQSLLSLRLSVQNRPISLSLDQHNELSDPKGQWVHFEFNGKVDSFLLKNKPHPLLYSVQNRPLLLSNPAANYDANKELHSGLSVPIIEYFRSHSRLIIKPFLVP